MTLNNREKVLMIATLVAVFGAAVYSFGLGDFLDNLSSQGEQLDIGEKRYVENLETLQKGADIQRRYRELERHMPHAEGKRADMVFTEEIHDLCRSLGINMPQLDPAEYEEIEGIEEHEFITVRLRTDGSLDTIVKLLKAFESRGLLFREVNLLGVRDQDLVRARVTLARIVKVPEDVLKARQEEKRRSRTRRGGYDF
jgi:hypothetical protein